MGFTEAETRKLLSELSAEEARDILANGDPAGDKIYELRKWGNIWFFGGK